MKSTGKPIPAPRFDADGYQTNLTALNGGALPDLTKAGVRPLRGGARSGAGRKPTGNQPVLLRLSPRTLKILRSQARRTGKTLSTVAEEKLSVRL